MLFLRSLAFNIAFYALTTFLALFVYLPLLVLPERSFTRLVAGIWMKSSLWLLRVIVGTRLEFRGLEHIPPGGLLVAAKHQSVLETISLFIPFDFPGYILKRELMWIPLFGWYLKKAGSVAIDRSAGSSVLVEMGRRAGLETARGRQILIFPEGTRRPPGAKPVYKFGIAHLYDNLGVPCLPVALNTGLFWPRRKFIRRPGTAVIEFLPPILPGLSRDAFFARLQDEIETASNRLIAEGMAQLGAAGLAAGVLADEAAARAGSPAG